MSGNPADVSHAGENIWRLKIKNMLDCHLSVKKIAGRSMNKPLWLASRARSIKQKERILSIHLDDRALAACIFNLLAQICERVEPAILIVSFGINERFFKTLWLVGSVDNDLFEVYCFSTTACIILNNLCDSFLMKNLARISILSISYLQIFTCARRTLQSASSIRWDSASAENPVKITEWTAPILAQASIAAAPWRPTGR